MQMKQNSKNNDELPIHLRKNAKLTDMVSNEVKKQIFQ